MNKIAIIGSAGIPAQYGGFETLAEYISKYIGNDVDITVFCSAKIYKQKRKKYNNVNLTYILLNANGIQSILYDIISLIKAALTHNTILILGVSGCIILPFFRFIYPSKKLIINIDGLEHRREKWNKFIRSFLKYSEKLAIKYGNIIIADNRAIQSYVKKEYEIDSTLIAYGGDHAKKRELTDDIKTNFSIPSQYAFNVCRIEPENNVHVILEAFVDTKLPLLIIGNWEHSNYGKKLKIQFGKNSNILMLDPIYEPIVLDQIRSNCTLYVHGHSAGGTNPSLVEAMNLGLPVFAFDVIYNRETTLNQALFFKNAIELRRLINNISETELKALGDSMEKIAKQEYTWEKVTNQYFKLF